MSIKVKDTKVLEGLLIVPFDTRLAHLAQWVATRYSEVVITSGYRKDSKGVHGTVPCRGIDIRSWIYSNPQVIVDDVNFHFIYDTERPEKRCAIFHNSGQGKHLHLQTHFNTEYMGG